MSRLNELVTLLKEGSRTKRELREMTGMSHTTVLSHLRRLEERRRVRPDGFRFSPPAIVWRWI